MAKEKLILVIDAGNTNLKVGAFSGSELAGSWRMAAAPDKTADEVGVFITSVLMTIGAGKSDIGNCIISTVVPDGLYSVSHGIRKYFDIEPMVVSPMMRMKLGVNKRANKRELGADRIANCEAAYTIYGGPVIVIDYGTATTYDVVDADGEFITGITAPGIKISAEALFSRTALLSKVELVMPESMIVANTDESVQAGIMAGRIGETEYIISRLKTELGFADAKVVATGGLSRAISLGTDVLEVLHPTLTLEGIRLLYEQNV